MDEHRWFGCIGCNLGLVGMRSLPLPTMPIPLTITAPSYAFARHLMLDQRSFESGSGKLIAEWSIKPETALMQVWNPAEEGVGSRERRL